MLLVDRSCGLPGFQHRRWASGMFRTMPVRLMTDDASQTFDEAIALYRSGRLGSARRALAALVAQQPDNALAWTALGYVERDIGELAASASAFDAALRLDPANPTVLAGRARIALERAEPDVLDRYAAASGASPGNPQLLLEQTEARLERGDSSAIDDFAAFMERHAEWSEGLVALARMRWETFADEDFAREARRALSREPRRLDLWLGLIQLLSSLDRFAAAAEAARDARRAVGDRPELLLAEAVNADHAREVERAGLLFAQLRSNEPVVAVPRALHLVRAGNLEAARRTIEAALAVDPHSISAWGVADLVFRAFGDERAHWLSLQEGLIRTFDLGLGADALDRVTRLLRSMHATGVQAAGQSVRDGTQTRWRLFDRAEDELAGLKAVIEGAIADYVSGLPPADEHHPLLRHRDKPLRITGSWSVRLIGSGRHVSHIHPIGLIGSASYFVVPGPEAGGELELGRPQPDLKLDLEPICVVRPEPGLLVLFPSYIHHGTAPFTSGERLSVAFDVALDPAAL